MVCVIEQLMIICHNEGVQSNLATVICRYIESLAGGLKVIQSIQAASNGFVVGRQAFGKRVIWWWNKLPCVFYLRPAMWSRVSST